MLETILIVFFIFGVLIFWLIVLGNENGTGKPMYSKKRQEAKMRYWDKKCGGPEFARIQAEKRKRK